MQRSESFCASTAVTPTRPRPTRGGEFVARVDLERRVSAGAETLCRCWAYVPVEGTGMAEEEFAPRLHVILARSADNAVVFRRGPSKRVATFAWDRTSDEVQLGQWLKGRIYERRSDLSPDG